MERTIKCLICGEPYKVYAFSAADQSACPSCVSKAERTERAPIQFIDNPLHNKDKEGE